MTHKDEAHLILDKFGKDYVKAAEAIYNGPRPLALYVLHVGLEYLASRRRATTRRNMEDTFVNPKFVHRPGAVYGSVKLSPGHVRKLKQATSDLFLTWCIGDTKLGDATKEFLVNEAQHERKTSKGHLRRAVFYEKLAEPMKSGQKVREYWQAAKAVELIRDDVWKGTEDKDVEFTDKE